MTNSVHKSQSGDMCMLIWMSLERDSVVGWGSEKQTWVRGGRVRAAYAHLLCPDVSRYCIWIFLTWLKREVPPVLKGVFEAKAGTAVAQLAALCTGPRTCCRGREVCCLLSGSSIRMFFRCCSHPSRIRNLPVNLDTVDRFDVPSGHV